ncbi:DUF6456 domain-containing protein [Paracoccus sp. KR1-242]|uniref:DUF6456 domain-containing protein n=1 Tax=Paracoccus sp. KR1-242 TaxID=3410028 RepID=UPI003C08D7CE
MTFQTGDLNLDAMLAGTSGGEPAAPAVTPSLTVLAASDAGDLGLYLRHVEGGESIRAIARELGCHASTILRRIRRFEARRDDPLVDQAIERVAADPLPPKPQGAGSRTIGRQGIRQVARILRRLAEPTAQLVVAQGMEKAIVVRNDIRTAILDRELAEHMALRQWVQMVGQGRVSRYVISSQGRDALRGLIAAGPSAVLPQRPDFALAEPVTSDPAPGLAEEAAPFSHADSHRIWEEREIQDPEDGRRRRTRVNIAESPLLMLARRREADGQPFLSPDMVAAEERLREDYELTQMGPRLAQNWDRFLTAGIDVSRGGAGYDGGSDSARGRVAAALRELGPGMGDLCLRVCCFLEGIEMTERRLGWSARSGKIVLRLALMRLERHYRESYGSGSPLIG